MEEFPRYEAQSPSECFFCRNHDIVSNQLDGEWKKYDRKVYCKIHGTYLISREGYYNIKRDFDFLRKAPAIARERKIQNRDEYALLWSDKKSTLCVDGIPFLADYPTTYMDKLDRVLLNLFHLSGSDPTVPIIIPCDDLSVFFIDPKRPYTDQKILNDLSKEGYLLYRKDNSLPPNYIIEITLQGAHKTQELLSSGINSRKAFLAMWFIHELDPYCDAVQKAISDAGYESQVANREEYNGPIMDKVMNMIDCSRFAIADLTCAEEELENQRIKNGVRGGVYFEAGYAMGQKKSLILTCRRDAKDSGRVHFDLDQFCMILWEDRGGTLYSTDGRLLSDAIRDRIIHTVGLGPVI